MKSAFARGTSVLLFALLLSGCAGSRHSIYLDPQFDFGSVERVAVVPFENLSTDQGTGKYITRLFFTQLLAQRAFDVVEPGDVSAFLATKSGEKSAELSVDVIKEMGKTLNVQAIIFGTVGEAAEMRSGNLTTHVVSIDARMVNTETGTTVWTASVNTEGPGFISRLLGMGEKTRGTAARNAVNKIIKSLVR